MPIPETKYKREQTVLYYTKGGRTNGEFLFIENHTTTITSPANTTVYHGILFKLQKTEHKKFPVVPVFVRRATCIPEEQLKSLEEAV